MSEQLDRKPIKLLLLDDHALVRESLARLLDSESGFELVAACATIAEGLETLAGSDVDVLLVDVGLANEFIASARNSGYSGKSLVVAREIDVIGTVTVLSGGAAGVFLHADASARLTQAIRLVAGGGAWIDQRLAQRLAARYPPGERGWLVCLTERERIVLDAIVEGAPNREIGKQMGLSESSIKGILQQLFGKFGVRTRGQLVRIALEGPPHGAAESLRTGKRPQGAHVNS